MGGTENIDLPQWLGDMGSSLYLSECRIRIIFSWCFPGFPDILLQHYH